MESIKLKRNNLKYISKGVKLPLYLENELYPSIVHIGLGHFHRAHQAFYLDDLLNRGLCRDRIFEINLIPDSFPLGNILEEQDYLYTLITKNPDAHSDVRIIASISGYMNAAENKEEALKRLADEKIKLVTLTVTEGGYYFDKGSGKPNLKEEAVLWDLANP